MASRNRPALLAALAVAAALSWQWLTVRYNYGGNWTALFETGGNTRIPSILAAERLYRFRGSAGFDGQQYHYIAHDPFLRTPDLCESVDEPRLRYRRILVPLLAWALALGRAPWIDPAFFVVCQAFVGLGVLWSARLARKAGFAAAWGLLFLLAPGVYALAALTCYGSDPAPRVVSFGAVVDDAAEVGDAIRAAGERHRQRPL